MKKIKIFAATDINTMQADINKWLSDNKDAHIIESNITSSTEYAFYILYTPSGEGEEESVIAASKQLPEELTQTIKTITEAN